MVENRAVITNPTMRQLEKRMICQFIFLSPNCNKTEIRRLFLLQTWAFTYTTNAKFTGNSLVSYIDKLANRAANYPAKVGYLSGYMATNGYSISVRVNNSYWSLNTNNKPIVWNFVCLNSSKLRIECQRTIYPDQSSNFTAFMFTFYLPKGWKPSTMNFTFNKTFVTPNNG